MNFVRATGRAEELNVMIAEKIDLYVENNRDLPKEIKVGEWLLDSNTNNWRYTDKYWVGYVGLLKLSIVSGDKIEIV